MKITKFSFVALIACMATSAMAANDLASAFTKGKLDGRLRAHYMGADYSDNGATGVNKDDSSGFAVGGSLIYKTAPLYGVSAGVGAYTTQNPFGITDDKGTKANYVSNKDLFWDSPTNSPYSYGKGYAVIAQAYAQYDISKTTLKAGRMLITNPFMNPNDTKMIPAAFEAYVVESKDVADTYLTAMQVTKYKERRREYFGSMSDSFDSPSKIKAYYNTETTAGRGGEANGVTVLGAKNSSIKGLELQGWFMNWPDIVSQLMLEANYGMKFGDVGLKLGARYFGQYDRGAGDIILPKTNNGDKDNEIDTHTIMARAVTSYGPAKLLLSYSKTDDGGDLLAPWRAFPTDGYTRSMTQTDWNANTKAYKAQVNYDLAAMAKGVKALLAYSYYNRDETKTPYQGMTHRGLVNGDTKQWNFDVAYKPSKSTEFKVRTMDQKNDPVALKSSTNKDTSVKELRIEANYWF